MAGVHDKGLLVGHRSQVLHDKTVLGPVLENCSVSAVGNQLMGMLCNSRIEVVLNHRHDGSRLTASGWIFVNGARKHSIIRTETIHVDASVLLQLPGKFFCEDLMMLLREVSQGIFDCQDFLLVAEYILAPGRVIYIVVIRFCLRKLRRDAFQNRFLKLCHK